MFFWGKKQKIDYNLLYKKFKDKVDKDILSLLEQKWGENFSNEIFSDKFPKKDSDWVHTYDFKIINLGGLRNFNQWLNAIVKLPESTAIYLTPFHSRDFECEYFIKDFDVDEKLKDNSLDLTPKEQVQAFIYFAKMAGHPVIYDFLTCFSRYSNNILKNPYLVRWIDVKFLENQISVIVDEIAKELEKTYDKDDIEIVKNIYYQESKGLLSEEYEKLYTIFEGRVLEKKKQLSKDIYSKNNQLNLQKRVKNKSIDELLHEGLWSIPCSVEEELGLPVFDYMNTIENYPVFRHFNENGDDVSENARNDFQTPAYFMDLESGKINKNVLKYFIDVLDKFTDDYDFDGFKINFTENIFENKNSDKIPVDFIKTLNLHVKKHGVKLIADFKYNKNLFKHYQNLGFDILWDEYLNLTPTKLLSRYSELTNYNLEDLHSENLSVVRIYNDRFGELSYIDKYPAQLGRDGALFRWFCLNFLPVGKNAKLPIVYLDGDETFTQKGFASTIYEYSFLENNFDEDFNNKFNAIRNFAKKSKIIKNGEANVILEEDDGFVCWMISKEPLKESLLVVANYNPLEEIIILENGNKKIKTYKENDSVVNKMINLPGECKVIKEYILDGKDFVEKDFKNETDLLEFEIIKPSSFRIFLLRK